MENITKGAVVLKSAPTAVDMGLINAQSIRELKAEEVFLFRIAACDNQVDRDFECFSDAALEALSKLFVGRTVLSDHRWSSSGQMARVYAAAVEKESGVSRLILSCYMLRNDAAAPAIDAIEAGILREVSVGVAVKTATCSICGTDKAHGYCEHRPGKAYDGTLCTVELGDPADAYEVSFVAVPAQREAGVVKSYGGDKESLGNVSKLDTSGGEDRKKRLSAQIELEKIKFVEEVPSNESEAETV